MNSLPDFPDFIKLQLSHKEILQAIASQFPPYSDYNFVSLFTWDTDSAIGIARLNDNLVVRFSDYHDGAQFMSLLGINNLSETIEVILAYCREAGLPTELRLVGEAVIEALPPEVKAQYEIQEDRDNHDYILSAVNMSDINQFHPKKRTKYNRFVREYENRFVCQQLNLDSPAVHEEIRQLLVDWQNIGKQAMEDAEREFAAINRCLKHHNELNILGYGTYVDSRLVAFTLFEIFHNKTAMLHFGKSDIHHKGSNEHLQHNLAKFLKGIDIELMNNEQDMGIEGLRKSKEASLPVSFLKKYTIAVR